MWFSDAALCLPVCFQGMWFPPCLALWDAGTVEARGSIWTGHPPPTVFVRDHVCLKVCVCVCVCWRYSRNIKVLPSWMAAISKSLPAQPVAHTHWQIYIYTQLKGITLCAYSIILPRASWCYFYVLLNVVFKYFSMQTAWLLARAVVSLKLNTQLSHLAV